MNPVVLGEIDLPEGILIILDPGLTRFWRHEGDPRSPRRSDPAEFDLEIVGDDAEAAGRAYDREFDPLHLFDMQDPERARKRFDDFAREKGFDARAQILADRIKHLERANLALRAGGGLAVVKYNGLWAIAVNGLPTSRGLQVVARPMEDDEFAGRWESIDVVVDGQAKVVRKDEVAGIMVDHGQFLFAGLGPLGDFKMWESLDGLADFVFWGPDARKLAKEFGASDLGQGTFGWRDIPIDAVGARADPLQDRVEQARLRVAVDYRPHCNLERLNSQVRTTETRAGNLLLRGSRVVGCDNRWSDGIFPVSRQFGADGKVVRVRVELGTEQRKKLMRQVRARSERNKA